ncbi:baseplate J/gp47 family protein [Neolewinella antarctica]|uniref:Baseplate protein J-like domain-containing protein n=1 Tax=Neolewinella antarctica TaxID=442734 RepID=A0ABX0X6H2_9BACT|nr:hypothetical protein [Neolewinella antarctica]NJC24665.1 hypothetical protein [Neolewinella antarctica]
MSSADRQNTLNTTAPPTAGSYQSTRLPAALAEGYLLIDDKQPSDWLKYVAAFSRHLRFFDLNDTERGTWHELYRNQPAVALATLASYDVEAAARSFTSLRARTEATSATFAERRDLMGVYFSRLDDEVSRLDEQVSALPRSSALHRVATELIRHHLAPAYARWRSYHYTATYPAIALRLVKRPDGVTSQSELLSYFTDRKLSAAWGPMSAPDKDSWGVFGVVAPPAGVEAKSRAIVHGIGHAFVHGVPGAFIQHTLHLRASAQKAFTQSLNKQADHAPHVALILAFLRIRETQRDVLNGLGDRHLRFYYERILRLRPARAKGHRTYVTHELRHGMASIVLPAGTEYDGGKAPLTGRRRKFFSEREASVSAATISDIRALYRGDDLRAGHVANSRDGVGKALPENSISWSPFGHLEEGKSRMPKARVGFALADNQLTAAAGRREITVSFGGNTEAIEGQSFKCKLTQEAGWYETVVRCSGGRLRVVIPAAEKPVTPYVETVHKENLSAESPLLLCVWDDANAARHHDLVKSEVFIQSVKCTVSALGEADLVGGGLVKSGQAFYPFGVQPISGDSVRLGLREAGLKEGKVTLDTLASPFANQIKATPQVGAVELKAKDDWPHRTYPKRLAEALITNGKAPVGASLVTVPDPPVPAQISSFSLSYASPATVPATVLRLTPFGHVPLLAEEPIFEPLVPLVGDTDGLVLGADAGAMLLGIANWEPGDQLRILFATEEGSADPLALKPRQHVRYAFLDGNVWRQFPSDKIDDRTNQLLTSGTIRFALPYDTATGGTQQGANKAWIGIFVQTTPTAVALLRGIHLHAVEVRQQLLEGQSISETVLNAGTVVKLAAKNPSVGKITQPYPSFGASGTESRDDYFSRASERMRHKGRGITAYDVERLVLAHVPEVERVICLPHVKSDPGKTYDELAAGHVTVVPLGRSGGSRANALRPFVSLATRGRISSLLKRRMSSHATIHVVNPVYEEVKVSARFTILPGTDSVWAIADLNERLIDYLSPWHNSGLGEVDFTATVHRAGVINFLEDVIYIDTIERLRLARVLGGSRKEGETLRSTKQTALLVSSARHELLIVDPLAGDGDCECCTEPGIPVATTIRLA